MEGKKDLGESLHQFIPSTRQVRCQVPPSYEHTKITNSFSSNELDLPRLLPPNPKTTDPSIGLIPSEQTGVPRETRRLAVFIHPRAVRACKGGPMINLRIPTY